MIRNVARVLIGEPDQQVAQAIASAVSNADMVPIIVQRARHFLYALETARKSAQHYDAIVASADLGGNTGLLQIQTMRHKGDFTPLFILTPSSDLVDRVGVLESGADGCFQPSVGAQEIVARIRAIIRLSHPRVIEKNELPAIGNLSFDRNCDQFVVNGTLMHLSKKQFALLESLFRRAGQIVTKEMLASLIAQGRCKDVMDWQVSRLRQSLAKAGATVQIKSIYAQGWLLAESSEPTVLLSCPEIGEQPAVGNLVYEKSTQVFKVANTCLALPPNQHILLKTLFERADRIVAKTSLDALNEWAGSTATMQTTIGELRKVLVCVGATVQIRIYYGQGCMLTEASKALIQHIDDRAQIALPLR